MRKLIYLLIITALACAPALYLPTQEIADKSGHSTEHLNRGRQLYIDNCGSCHQLHLPKEFSEPVWRNNLDSMSQKANISGEEKQLILDYLLTGK